MKKMVIFFTTIFLSVFLLHLYDVNASASTNSFDDQYNGYYDIFDADITKNEEGHLFVSFEYNELELVIPMSNFNYYVLNSKPNVLNLEIIQNNIQKYYDMNLIYSSIEIMNEKNKLFFTLVFEDVINCRLVRIYFLEDETILDNLNVFTYDEYDGDIVKNIQDGISLYYRYKDLYFDIYKPSVLSNDTFDNTIDSVKSLDKYTDGDITYYNVNENTLAVNGKRVDDTIVNYIPKSYFFISDSDLANNITQVEHLEYGSGYGFYIRTKLEGTNRFGSYVTVFKIKFTYPTGYYGGNGVNLSTQVEFIPLFNIVYLSLKKNSDFSDFISFNGDSVVTDVENPYLNYGFSDFLITNTIGNYNGANYGAAGYNIETDQGLCITKNGFELINHENNDEIDTSEFTKDAILTFAGVLPGLAGDYVSYFSMMDFLRETMIGTTGYYSDPAIKDTYKYEHYNYDANNQMLQGKFIKDVSFGLENILDSESTKKYYFGQYNYMYWTDSQKIGIKGFIEYAKATSTGTNTLVQNSEAGITVSLYSMESKTKIKSLRLADINYFNYSSPGCLLTDSFSSNVNVTNEGDIILPLFFSATKLVDFSFNSTNSINVTICNQFGTVIFSEYQPKNISNIIVGIGWYERYFLIISLTSGTSSEVDISINDYNLYSMNIGDNICTMTGYQMIAYELSVSANQYYTIQSLGGDTEVYVYSYDFYYKYKLIGYNDDWYSWDEEMNQEYEEEAIVGINLYTDKTYYVVVRCQGYGGSINTTIS